MMRYPFCLLMIGLAWGILAPAAADPPRTIGPEEAVRIALENHPLLEASAAEIDAARAERSLARSGYLPRIDLSEDLARSTNPVFVFASKLGQERFGPEDFEIDSLNRPDALTNSALRVSLRQSVWDAGRTRLGNRAAGLGVDAAERNRERTRQEIAYGALSAYWDSLVAAEMLVVATDAEKAAEANLALAGDLVDAGLAVPSDRMSAEVRLAEVQALRIRAQQGVEVASVALLRALGLDRDARVRAVRTAGEAPAAADSLEARMDAALRSRPDLLALERQLEQARIGRKVARSRRLPEVGAQANYEWNGDSLLGTDGDNWTVGLGVSLSVFDGRETKARVARAGAQAARLEAMLEAMRQGVELEVRAAWAASVGAERRLEVAATALARSAEALRIVRERYGEGMAVMVELLGAEAAHTRARANHVEAEGDLWLARAALDLASGKLDTSKDGVGDAIR